MPILSVRCSDVEAARLRAAAAARGVTPSALVREAVMRAAGEALRALDAGEAAPVIRPDVEASAASSPPPPTATDGRRGRDRRKPREAYTDGDVARWGEAVADHGERRAARWPERRAASPSTP